MVKLILLYFASNKNPHEDAGDFERRKNEHKNNSQGIIKSWGLRLLFMCINHHRKVGTCVYRTLTVMKFHNKLPS
jgi:hypothetical protein